MFAAEAFASQPFAGIPAGLVSVFRPGSDIATAGWTGNPNASLYANLDELVRDDASYAQSPDLYAGPQEAVFGLEPSPLPPGSWTLTYAAQLDGAAQVRFSLLDDADTMLGASSWQPVVAGYTQYTASISLSVSATRMKIEVQL